MAVKVDISPVKKLVIVGAIGDSTAVLFEVDGNGTLKGFDVITELHVGDNEEEAERIRSLGGEIRSRDGGGIGRVNGQLAVTRSFGDKDLKALITAEPDVVVLRRDGNEEVKGRAGREYIIVASDGLWDVMDARDAVEMAVETMGEGKEDLQNAAERLTLEAFVRGTTDNVGVLILRI